MKRALVFRVLAPAGVLMSLAAFAAGTLPGSLGGVASAETVAPITRDAANPAWGKPRWTMQFAFDGKCDDPRYVASTGKAEAGSDEADCQRVGGGLKG